MSNQSLCQVTFDDVKHNVTLEQACYWYECETSRKPTKTTAKERRYGTKGSLSIELKDGCVLWKSFEDNKGGSIIDLVAYVMGYDEKQSFELVKKEILNIQPPSNWQSQQKKQRADKPADPKKDYQDLCKNWPRLQAGLDSQACIELFRVRGLDETKIHTLGDNIGYDTRKQKLVFRDGVTAKFMTFNPDGHRKDTWHIAGGGDCHWQPESCECDNVYLVEGEFDAIALHFMGLYAIPLKPDDKTKDRIVELCKKNHVYLAYDNDKAGHKFAKDVIKYGVNCTDITTIWYEGEDPNDFIKKHKAESRLLIEQKIKEIESQAPQATIKEQPILLDKNMNTAEKIKRIQQYFYDKAKALQTPAAKRAFQDDLIKGFVSNIDPYSMRCYASAFCLIAWGVARLSLYRIEAPSNPRIINLVAKSSAGKDWVLGTHAYSHSLFYQLKKEIDFSVYQSSEASITGNGMSKAAFLWAAKDENKNKVRGMFWPEFGNAQTRGFGQAERAGSIGNYDVGLCSGIITKPQNKSDMKELQEYKDEYKFNGFEVRAFQDINGAKVVIPRMQGSGEARREFWFYMQNPIDDPACNDLDVPFYESAFKESAFTDDGCDNAFRILQNHALSVLPVAETFEDRPNNIISTTITGKEFCEVYEYLMKSRINAFYTANRYELLRDKLQYLAGLSAGIHGRREAIECDYWIAGWLCECLSDSLNLILSEGDNIEVDTRRSSVIEMVKLRGEQGIYRNRLLSKGIDQKILEELSGAQKIGNNILYDDDAPLVYLLDKNRKGKYIAREFIDGAMRFDPDLRKPSLS